MILEHLIADITATLGDPATRFVDREIGPAYVSGWTWVRDSTPWGLRLEQIGDRYTVRAFTPGRRAELILRGEPGDDEVRAVATLGGLLPAAAFVGGGQL